MRILQIGKFYPIRGGVEKVMWNLTRGLQEQGVPCDMLCARFKDAKADAKDLPYAEEDGFRFHPLGKVYCVRAWKKVAATMLSPAMVRWLRQHQARYDIIHIHHPDPMAALALRMSGFKGKVVLHWHSDILSQKALLRLYKPLQSWLIGRADRIVGTTPRYLQESPWLRDVQDKCVAVPIGIREQKAAPADVEALRARYPGKTLLLSVGRLVPYKGFSTLLEALALLPERFHLLLGGMGPLEEALKAQAVSSGLTGRVTFLGYVPEADLPACFAACDLYVLSSCLKTEAFGIVQLEAMCAGKPVVSTQIPGSGVPWVNEDGVTGRIALPGNPQSLARAILDVDGKKETYGPAARARFLRLFTEETMTKTMITLYENLL